MLTRLITLLAQLASPAAPAARLPRAARLIRSASQQRHSSRAPSPLQTDLPSRTALRQTGRANPDSCLLHSIEMYHTSKAATDRDKASDLTAITPSGAGQTYQIVNSKGEVRREESGAVASESYQAWPTITRRHLTCPLSAFLTPFYHRSATLRHALRVYFRKGSTYYDHDLH